ncbi:MAG: transposase, partial [Candidatus Aenigmatarchaeota archaeon]
MTLKTANVVRRVINKNIVPPRPIGKGNPGYEWHIVVRILVYAILSGIFTNKGLVTHLKNNPEIARTLGLKKIPHRKSISRWKKQKWKILEMVIENLGKFIQEIIKNKLLIF